MQPCLPKNPFVTPAPRKTARNIGCSAAFRRAWGCLGEASPKPEMPSGPTDALPKRLSKNSLRILETMPDEGEDLLEDMLKLDSLGGTGLQDYARRLQPPASFRAHLARPLPGRPRGPSGVWGLGFRVWAVGFIGGRGGG